MYMTIQQYADHVGVHYSTVREMCVDGRIPCVMFGNRRKIDPAQAQAALEEAARRKSELAQSKTQNRVATQVKRKMKPRGDFLATLKAMSDAIVI